MPSSHQFYHDWSAERFIRWAEKHGPHTAQLIQSVLNTKEHPEQAYRACIGILKFSDRYDRERLEAVCRYALLQEVYTYRGVRNILENQLEKADPDDRAMQSALLLPHANIRGKDYYH